jgi:aspartate aminotransferase-like enzyme
MTRAALLALGFKLFNAASPGAAATAVCAPEGVDSGLIVKELKSRFAAIITNGQGEMKGQLFRIAHIGYFDYLDTIAILGALEQVAATSLKLPDFHFGKALVAAQKTFAERTRTAQPELAAAR